MAHHISGLITRRETLSCLEIELARQPFFELAEGLVFLPLDDQNLDKIVGLDVGKALGTFEYLTERLIEVLCAASRNGELIYVETEYFGGVGGQGAAVSLMGQLYLDRSRVRATRSMRHWPR